MIKKETKDTLRGITLIALIITIIVLLILAGVTVGLLTGENGILRNAQIAEEEYEKQKGMEQVQLVLGDDIIEKSITGKTLTLDRLIDIFKDKTWVSKIIKIEKENKITILNHRRYIYDIIIKEDGTIQVEYIGNGPVISKIIVVDKDTKSIEIEVEAINTDSLTYRYLYKKENETSYILAGESINNKYIYENLEENQIYNIKVEVLDKSGNIIEKTITETAIPYPTIESTLKEGDYVNYIDATGKIRKCAVLYGPENTNYASYGIQIITMETVEEITLGVRSDFNTNKTIYNNVIVTLNEKVGAYLNTKYATSARSVGTVPNSPNSESGYHTNSYSYFTNYNGTLKDTDNNYQADWNQMNTLGIYNINKAYCLGSRNVHVSSVGTAFRIYYVDSSLEHDPICYVNSSLYTGANSSLKNIRPVFTLKSGIKVTEGLGTIESPYKLGP